MYSYAFGRINHLFLNFLSVIKLSMGSQIYFIIFSLFFISLHFNVKSKGK